MYSLSPQFHKDATSETDQLVRVLNIVSEMKDKSLSQKLQDDGGNEKCVIQYLYAIYAHINQDLQLIGNSGACRGGSEGRNNLQPPSTRTRALDCDAVQTQVHDLLKNGDQLGLIILLQHYYMYIINCLLKGDPLSADNMVHETDTFFQNLVENRDVIQNKRNMLSMLEKLSPNVIMRHLRGLNELGIQFDKEILSLKDYMIQLLKTTTNGFNIGSLSPDIFNAVVEAMDNTNMTITTTDGVTNDIIFGVNNDGRNDYVVYPCTITWKKGEVGNLYFIHPDDRGSVYAATNRTRDGQNMDKLALYVVTNNGKTYREVYFSTSIRRDGNDEEIGVEFTGQSDLLEQEDERETNNGKTYREVFLSTSIRRDGNGKEIGVEFTGQSDLDERENASKRRRTETYENDSSSGRSSSEETVNTEDFSVDLSITSGNGFAEWAGGPPPRRRTTSSPLVWVDVPIPPIPDDGGDNMNDDSSNEGLDLLLDGRLLATPTPIPLATNGNDYVVGNNNFQPIVDELPIPTLPHTITGCLTADTADTADAEQLREMYGLDPSWDSGSLSLPEDEGLLFKTYDREPSDNPLIFDQSPLPLLPIPIPSPMPPMSEMILRMAELERHAIANNAEHELLQSEFGTLLYQDFFKLERWYYSRFNQPRESSVDGHVEV